jgi:hypothetical protein
MRVILNFGSIVIFEVIKMIESELFRVLVDEEVLEFVLER